jgi:hypothetical protein
LFIRDLWFTLFINMMIQLFEGITATLPLVSDEVAQFDAALREAFFELTLGFVRHLDHYGAEGRKLVRTDDD